MNSHQSYVDRYFPQNVSDKSDANVLSLALLKWEEGLDPKVLESYGLEYVIANGSIVDAITKQPVTNVSRCVACDVYVDCDRCPLNNCVSAYNAYRRNADRQPMIEWIHAVIDHMDSMLDPSKVTQPVNDSHVSQSHQHDQSSVIELTHRKTAHIIERDGFNITGFVMTHPDGRTCIVNDSAVRWFHDNTGREFFKMMHPEEPIGE